DFHAVRGAARRPAVSRAFPRIDADPIDVGAVVAADGALVVDAGERVAVVAARLARTGDGARRPIVGRFRAARLRVAARPAARALVAADHVRAPALVARAARLVASGGARHHRRVVLADATDAARD